jgi:hypothetical protein
MAEKGDVDLGLIDWVIEQFIWVGNYVCRKEERKQNREYCGSVVNFW